MNKRILQVVLAIAALAVVAVAAYYLGFDRGSDSANENESATNNGSRSFSSEGLLLRNRDDLKPDTWYLSYEENGQGRLAELIVTNEQIGSFSIGQRVSVAGQLSNNELLTVENITAVGMSENNNGADVEFRKSDVYGFYGTLTLSGYLDVVRRVCNPGDMCSETVEYATFVFRNPDNQAIREFAGEYQGNSFVGDHGIGIGCVQEDKNQIFYENDADSGWKTGTITGADYSKLLASTENNLVQIRMTREIYTSGRGAPDCYSHFRNFDVL